MADSSLGDNAEIVMGQSPPAKACNPAGLGLPLLNGPTEFGPHHPIPLQFTTDAKKRARPGDILFCVRGSTTGRMNWADREYAIGRGVAAVRHRWASGLQSFVRAVIEYGLPGLLAQATGSTFPNVSANQLASLRWPPLDDQEQGAIAHILGTLEDKIELNRRMNETLEAMARALFKSWFVDFDPVRAKAEGRDPGLPKPLADLFPDRFEDSELGEIPKRWRVAPIGELAHVVGGSTPSTKKPAFWDDGRHYWATPKDLSGLATPVLLETERKITDAGLARIGSGLLPAGTVLLSSRAPIGYLAVSEVPVAINQGFIAMVPAKGVSNLFLLLWAEWVHEEIVSRANGSTFLEISKANFRPIPVVKPPSAVLGAFEQMVRRMYMRIVSNERESRTLATVRDTLLPKLISGELRVKDPEHFMEQIR
jgi:type I restriction enzyme S subunit